MAIARRAGFVLKRQCQCTNWRRARCQRRAAAAERGSAPARRPRNSSTASGCGCPQPPRRGAGAALAPPLSGGSHRAPRASERKRSTINSAGDVRNSAEARSHHHRSHGCLLVVRLHHAARDNHAHRVQRRVDRCRALRGAAAATTSCRSSTSANRPPTPLASPESINRSLQEENEALQAQLNQAQLERRAAESLPAMAPNAGRPTTWRRPRSSRDPCQKSSGHRQARRPRRAASRRAAARTPLRRGKHGLHHYSAALSGGDDDERAVKLEQRFGSNDTPEPAADDFAEEKDDAITERIRPSSSARRSTRSTRRSSSASSARWWGRRRPRAR